MRKTIVVSKEAHRLLRLFDKKASDVLRDALVYFTRHGSFDYVKFSGYPEKTVVVDDDVHGALSYLKAEVGFKRVGDVVYALLVGYLKYLGVDEYCIDRIVKLEV